MATDKKISELADADALTGPEFVEVVQGGVNKKTTTQAIADLGGGGGTWGSITGTLSAQTDLQSALDDKAPLASPALTGTPTAPTPSQGDNDTSIATTAFVTAAVAASTNIIDQVSTSVAGGTITLDMNSQKQRSHYGSASFASAKILAMSNTTGALFFNFFFEITSVSAVLTFPSDWISSSPDFNGTTWTPPTTGKFEFGGSYNGLWTQWNIKVNGPSA